MKYVLLTALGVGGATVLGAAIGYLFGKPSRKQNDTILGFAAGVMLAAAVVGLILPSMEYGGDHSVLVTVVGVLAGALFLNLVDKFTPHLHRVVGADIECHDCNKNISKVILFVLAIAIHNFPEGIAAGVSFGTGNMSDAFTVSLGIALQNIPEGMIIIAPLVSAGASKVRAFGIAALTGLAEVVGTLIGYFAVSISAAVLPFALAFAGGTMLYVISDEMIPETHSGGFEKQATYSLLLGFCVMLLLDFYI